MCGGVEARKGRREEEEERKGGISYLSQKTNGKSFALDYFS